MVVYVDHLIFRVCLYWLTMLTNKYVYFLQGEGEGTYACYASSNTFSSAAYICTSITIYTAAN